MSSLSSQTFDSKSLILWGGKANFFSSNFFFLLSLPRFVKNLYWVVSQKGAQQKKEALLTLGEKPHNLQDIIAHVR